MSTLIRGDRIGRDAKLGPGATAIIFDDTKQKVLLTQRSDNGRWCLPGGGMDPGESAAETCIREVVEETGLIVEVTRLIGVYTSPDIIMAYADGNRLQPVAFCFEAKVEGGELGLSDETIAYGFFDVNDLDGIDLMEHHKERIEDAVQWKEATFIR